MTELLARVHRQLMHCSQTHSEHLRSVRQDRLGAFSCALMRCDSAPECWDALHHHIAEALGVRLFVRVEGSLREHGGDHVLDLSLDERSWGALMNGESVWLSTSEAELCGMESMCAFIAPLHDGERVHGVMWRAATRRSYELDVFIEQAARVMMTMLVRISRAREPLAPRGPTREFLDRIIEASPDAIVAADRQGRIILFNTAAERILNWSSAHALGDDVRRLYQEGVAYQIMHRLRAEKEGGWGKLATCREILLTRDREAIPVELSASLIVRDSEVLGSVGLFRDLRDRIAMEGQLERATQDLEAHREQVVMAEMAGATAHELNQPLTSMLNYVDVLKLDAHIQSTPRTRRAVEIIERDITRLAEIVKHIAKITQYRTRDYVHNTRILDLGEESS